MFPRLINRHNDSGVCGASQPHRPALQRACEQSGTTSISTHCRTPRFLCQNVMVGVNQAAVSG